MPALIWIVLSIIFVFWLLGNLIHVGGDIIHILLIIIHISLIIVIFGVIYQLFTNRRV